jgi:8-oxo-dGTP pyrophosphatase MutT (NUDIX family)
MINILFRAISFLRRIYWFIFRPNTYGVKIIAVSAGKVLLVKNRYDKYWYLPGGGIKKGENSLQCARREGKEECGIVLENLKVLAEYTNIAEYKKDQITLLFGDISGQNTQKGLEIDELGFFDMNFLPENTSSATKRRINEYLSGTITNGNW